MSLELSQDLIFSGIKASDIQRIFQDTIDQLKNDHPEGAPIPGVMLFDVSYLYNFHLDDFEYIRKYNIRMRYNQKLVFEWHRKLERWMRDETVTVLGREIKPIKIVRSVDRVPNEGLSMLARCLIGEEMMPIQWHGLGIGATAGDKPLPSDSQLVTEISRINVTTSVEGGSLSRDGSTIYINGNHPKTMEGGNITEMGAWDAEHMDHDLMADHSILPTSVPHTAGADSAGGTIIIYMCSS